MGSAADWPLRRPDRARPSSRRASRHAGDLSGRQQDWPEPNAPTLALPYPQNRRDGARLLSSALVITSIGLIAHNPAGWTVAGLGGLVSLYCWSRYRLLER